MTALKVLFQVNLKGEMHQIHLIKKVLKKYVISFKIATDNESDSYYDMIYEIATRIINT